MKNQLELKKGLKKKLKIVPIGLGFSFWTALGLGLGGLDLGLGLDNMADLVLPSLSGLFKTDTNDTHNFFSFKCLH